MQGAFTERETSFLTEILFQVCTRHSMATTWSGWLTGLGLTLYFKPHVGSTARQAIRDLVFFMHFVLCTAHPLPACMLPDMCSWDIGLWKLPFAGSIPPGRAAVGDCSSSSARIGWFSSPEVMQVSQKGYFYGRQSYYWSVLSLFWILMIGVWSSRK